MGIHTPVTSTREIGIRLAIGATAGQIRLQFLVEAVRLSCMIPHRTGSMNTRRPLLLFFTLAFSLSWLCWAPLVLARFGLISFQPSRYLHLLGSFGPALAALITAGICGGRAQQRDLLRRAFAWRVPLRWHLLAWLSPLLLFATAALVARLVGGETWDWRTTGTSLEYPELPVLTYWAASLVFYGWGEETGWRGFALPYLQQRRSALAATLWLSVLWALWHLPLFAFASGLSRMGLAEIAGWYFSILTGAVLFTWLVNSTGGSVLIAAVFHGTMDVVFVSPAPAILSNVLGALITMGGVIVLVANGPRSLSRQGKVVAEGVTVMTRREATVAKA